MRLPFVLLAGAALLATITCGSPAGVPGRTGSAATGSGAGSDGGAPGLHVVGNHLVDGSGKVVQLHGVNRSGTEYACVQGWGIFDGPNDDKSVKAIASWHVNIVRVLLNED